jgi:hypothetical protein
LRNPLHSAELALVLVGVPEAPLKLSPGPSKVRFANCTARTPAAGGATISGNRSAENVSLLCGPVEQGLERDVVPVLVNQDALVSEGGKLGGSSR